jgi:hypothetical protein
VAGAVAGGAVGVVWLGGGDEGGGRGGGSWRETVCGSVSRCLKEGVCV